MAARRARVAVSFCFMVMGMTGGAWTSRIPAVKAQAHLSDGTLGLALFAVPIGLILGAAAAERLVDRVGSAPAAWVSGIALGVLTVPPGAARSLPELMAALLAVGAAGGTMDVAQNAQGVLLESAYGRPVMTSLHACFSLGAIAGSLSGGGFALAGVSALGSLAAAGITGALIVAVAGRWFLASLPYKSEMSGFGGEVRAGVRGRETRADVRKRARADAGEDAAGRRAERGRVRRVVIALGVLAACGMVGEGAAGDWSAVYLKENLGTSAGFAVLGFAAFSATMTGGRLIGDRLVRRFGAATVVRACGITATSGLAAALATASPQVTVAGFAVLGAGLSVVVPQAFLAGGLADPERPGSGLARVVGLGYAGLAAGPAVIGAVASRGGLRAALAIPLVLALWIAVAAPAVAKTPQGRKAEQTPLSVRDNGCNGSPAPAPGATRCDLR